ncbi:MAG: hypothetical protein U0136_12285 [Bdellovibrionota bacterium]
MNASRVTQKYVREHPSVADCLARGLVNYSALAREICAATGIESFDAVLIACRRMRAKHRAKQNNEKKIFQLLKSAKVRIRNKIVVIIVDKAGNLEKALALQKFVRADRGDFNLIEGEDVFTLVTNLDYLTRARESFEGKLRKVSKQLVQISMLFDESLESVPGVVANIYRLFAENNINIREEMSCWTEVMIIIDEQDIAKAMQLLSGLS